MLVISSLYCDLSVVRKYIIMRNYFFDKGQELKAPFGEFILAYNKLDSHHYALQRIENCDNNYVCDFYSCFDDSHFLRYYTCWEEEQIVAKKIEKQQNTETKGPKKKSMNLASFLSKKKTQVFEPSIKNEGVSKSKKDVVNTKQELIKTKVVYVQLQGFQNMKIPNSVEEVKFTMAVIYLLAQAVNKAQGLWPCMIPVISNDSLLRFVKKGSTRNSELVKLFQHMMGQKKIDDWSNQMTTVYEMFKINSDMQILAQRIHHDLTLISKTQYEIILVVDGKKKVQKVKIIEPQILLLCQSDLKLSLVEFTITFSYIDQLSRQVTLQHYVQDSITFVGESNNFIIRYLKTFRLK